MRRRTSRCIAVLAAAAAALGGTALLAAPPASAASPDPLRDPTRVSLTALRPSLTRAFLDRPALYTNGCHAASATTAARACTYGNRTGRFVVVAFGDSHLTQWFPALDAVARAQGWRLLWLTKSACPAPDVVVRRWRGTTTYPQCTTWRRNAIARIRALPRVDLLVTSSSANHQLLRPGTNAAITSPSARAATWRAGLDRTLARLTGHVRRLVLVRDTPSFRRDVPSCLRAERGNALACGRSLRAALPSTLWTPERSVVARRSWARTLEMTDRICQPTRCLPVTSTRILRWRDDNHLTQTFSRAVSVLLRYRLLVALR